MDYNLTDYGLNLHSKEVQTATIQKVLDLAGETGGRVIFPNGEYITGGLLLHSNTVLFFEKGAHLSGSAEPSDYPVFDIPAGVETRTDMDMLPGYFIKTNQPRAEYRRAVLSAYGEENIGVIGEGADSVIDGRDCFDPEGEEGLRGPHGIFFSNCKNVVLQDYVIKNPANFHHQLDANENVEVHRVCAFGGHDGFHLHFCKNVHIEGCLLYTGDDCIAGINMENVTVRNCTLNTSCQLFRIGGRHIHVENCRMFGPGIYPYRRSIMTGPNEFMAQSEGHHDIISFMEYFSSTNFPQDSSVDIVFHNCTVENIHRLLWYRHDVSSFDGAHFCAGTPLRSLIFSNVRFTGVEEPSLTTSAEETPLHVILKNVTSTGTDGKEMPLFDEASENLVVTKEDAPQEAPDLDIIPDRIPEEELEKKMFKYADEETKEKAANGTLLAAFLVIAIVFILVGILLKK